MPSPVSAPPLPDPSVAVTLTNWQGILPHPDDLQRYEDLCPGAARMIIEQARDQTEHRIAMESAVIYSNIRHRDRSLIAGAVAVIGALVAAVLLALIGVAEGYLLGVAAVIGAVTTTLYGVRTQQAEREQKRQEAAARLPPARPPRR